MGDGGGNILKGSRQCLGVAMWSSVSLSSAPWAVDFSASVTSGACRIIMGLVDQQLFWPSNLENLLVLGGGQLRADRSALPLRPEFPMLRVAFLVNSFSDLEREVTLLRSLFGFWAFQNGPPPWESKDQCEG